jgi:hypothetical protein
LCKVAEKFEKCAAPVNVIRKYNNLWYDMWLYNNIVALYYFLFCFDSFGLHKKVIYVLNSFGITLHYIYKNYGLNFYHFIYPL